MDAGHRHRLGDVDRHDPRVRVRAAQRVAPEHPRHDQVARVRELALHLRRRVGARDDARRSGRPAAARRVCGLRHASAPRAARRRRSSRSRCSGRGCPRAPRGSRRRTGRACARSRSAVATTRPGVQKPHCTAPASTNACCTGCSASPSASPSTVVTSWPSACAASTRHAQTSVAVEQHRARAALALLARVLRAREAELLAQREEQRLALPAVGLVLLAVDAQRDPHAQHPLERALGQHAQRVAAVARRCRARRRSARPRPRRAPGTCPPRRAAR